MTQEQKNLLLKDLCSRLPYGVKILVNDKVEILQGINILDNVIEYGSWLSSEVEEVKPYLFPLSSTTEEQKRDLNKLSEKECEIIEDVVNNPTPSNIGFPVVTHYMVDWCSKNHFDYRGLIPMGLANDATGLNIY